MGKILLFVSSACLLGCAQIEIEKAELPDDLVGNLVKITGTYHGVFDRRQGTMDLNLVPSSNGHRMVVRVTGFAGDDLIGAHCDSQVGDLRRVWMRTVEGKEISRAAFDFSAGKCAGGILGDTLHVRISVENGGVHLRLALLAGYVVDRNCRQEPAPPVSSGRKVCDPPYVQYLRGRFSRSVFQESS